MTASLQPHGNYWAQKPPGLCLRIPRLCPLYIVVSLINSFFRILVTTSLWVLGSLSPAVFSLLRDMVFVFLLQHLPHYNVTFSLTLCLSLRLQCKPFMGRGCVSFSSYPWGLELRMCSIRVKQMIGVSRLSNCVMYSTHLSDRSLSPKLSLLW